ncbi:MAG: stage II sporulation protein M [Planctomycetia bacterium]|nr:stage II sporulation protein M [Planctomycetia bacterium]
MNKRKFVARRAVAWHRFEQLLDRLDTISLRRFSPAETAEFSRLFRELCYDLSLIRSRDWGRGLVSYLNDLVSRGHNAFYSSPPGNLAQVARFLAVGFPQLFRRNIGYFLTAAALFFGSLGITWAVVQNNPALATRIVDAQTLRQAEWMYSDHSSKGKPGSQADDEDWQNAPDFAGQRSFMAGFYVLNNVGIAFRCFASGILGGVGSVVFLLYNGIFIGALAGDIIATGHSEKFLSFVVSHGSFELTAIAVAGGAGLMLGNSLIHPGQRTRLESLRVRGLEAIQIACGAGAMLVIAALIEAFWSPSVAIPNPVKYAGGGVMWILVFVYLSTAGRWESKP